MTHFFRIRQSSQITLDIINCKLWPLVKDNVKWKVCIIWINSLCLSWTYTLLYSSLPQLFLKKITCLSNFFILKYQNCFFVFEGPCNPGERYVLNDLQCVKCRVGTYQPSSGQFQCSECPYAIKFTIREGAVAVEECKSKYYINILYMVLLNTPGVLQFGKGAGAAFNKGQFFLVLSRSACKINIWSTNLCY